MPPSIWKGLRKADLRTLWKRAPCGALFFVVQYAGKQGTVRRAEGVYTMNKPTEYTLTWEVTDEMTAKRIGSAGSKILSTPNMVALMEATALELAKAYLEEGETTVGAEIHCRHLAPTPVGMKVSATARLREIERRKMWFDIEVNDEKGKCGEGSHLRIKITPKNIAEKAGTN